MRGHSTAMGCTPSGGPKPLVTTWPLVALPVVALPRLLQPWAPSVGAVRGRRPWRLRCPAPIAGRPASGGSNSNRSCYNPPTNVHNVHYVHKSRAEVDVVDIVDIVPGILTRVIFSNSDPPFIPSPALRPPRVSHRTTLNPLPAKRWR